MSALAAVALEYLRHRRRVRALRELLRLAANTIHPSPDGLAKIRARTREGRTPDSAAPGARPNGPQRETGRPGPPETAAPNGTP